MYLTNIVVGLGKSVRSGGNLEEDCTLPYKFYLDRLRSRRRLKTAAAATRSLQLSPKMLKRVKRSVP